jgi:hypothetical protein
MRRGIEIFNSNKKELAQIGLSTSNSEDIQILDNKTAKYLEFQDKIREVISANTIDRDVFVSDVVDAISKLSGSQTLWNILSLGIVPIKNHLKRKRLRKTMETILRKIFDITLGWYVMDYEDLKETCDYVGGRDYFSREDHRHIYIAVIQKLKDGLIRDKCIELGIISFVNEKLADIRDNFLKFKAKEL